MHVKGDPVPKCDKCGYEGFSVDNAHRNCPSCCDLCNYDRHVCPGCGTPLNHDGTEVPSGRSHGECT